MTKSIWIINGTGGSGKDTFVEFVSRYVKVKNFSSIDIVKEIARHCGWDGGKREADRKFLSDLKFLLTDYNDLPFKSTVKAVEDFKKSDAQIMFIHIREPENIARAVKELGALTLLIKRDGLDNIASNVSDANVDNYNYDTIIENTTLDNLNLQAKAFADKAKTLSDSKPKHETTRV